MCQTCAVSLLSEVSMLIGRCCVYSPAASLTTALSQGGSCRIFHTIPHYRVAIHIQHISDYAARRVRLQYVCRADLLFRRHLLLIFFPSTFCIWLHLQHKIQTIIPYSLLFPEALRPSSLVFHVGET